MTLSEVKDRTHLVQPHVGSFNFIADEGLDLAVRDIQPVEVDDDAIEGQAACRLWVEDVKLLTPEVGESRSGDSRMFPRECRERRLTYAGKLVGQVVRECQGIREKQEHNFGLVPIMVKSNRCNLAHPRQLSGKELIAKGEEEHELGGYFICKGHERVVRMLVANRRHHLLALNRPSYANRGKLYSPFGIQMRCVRPDQSGQTVVLHYVEDGTATLEFTIRKQQFLVPAMLLLKCFKEVTDREIFEQIMHGESNTFLSDRAELMLREHKKLDCETQLSCLQYLGRLFRNKMSGLSRHRSDAEIGTAVIKRHLFVHLGGDLASRFPIMIEMYRKLIGLVKGDVKPDNPDAVHCHEVLTPGHLYNMFLKEKIEEFLENMRSSIARDISLNRREYTNSAYFSRLLARQQSLGDKCNYLLNTGNLMSSSGLDLMQVSGFTVVADKINYVRFLSHFRAVHRGQFFTTMKTTAVRKLLPEAWGFVCPVHTPDGGPCGLLNHMSGSCKILTHNCSVSNSKLRKTLGALGMQSLDLVPSATHIPVMLDGVLVGRVRGSEAREFCRQLRWLKVHNQEHVPPSLEIVCVPDRGDKCYPSIVLGTTPARFIRPVTHLQSKRTEWLSPLEQVWLDIACDPKHDIRPETTHCEITPTNMLSALAACTPFSDFNQSPRNMYQCQMAKQTMGVPVLNYPHRTDNKIYRIQTPQKPLVFNEAFTDYSLNDYPLGTNAVVAVISYTGYDMEDAMIINKHSYDRGFAHGSVYKNEIIDLSDFRKKGEPISHFFSNRSSRDKDKKIHPSLDIDGLPIPGTLIKTGDPVYSVYNAVTGKTNIKKHKDREDKIIDTVRIIDSGPGGQYIQKVNITYRLNRNPVIGDKFSSRHGQKGTLSQLWPAESMPWTESGMQPDLLINPHAFPSRMTIGMLIESMAAKGAALDGKFIDATPFKFDETPGNRAVEHFGEELLKHGYHQVGSEPMYSGVSGLNMQCDIYIGLVYYQRLRHMVSDKSQVRSTGAINQLTRQPVKGRKKGGGVRFGEMERDALLGHGASFLLQDRLLNCSDYHTTHVCENCGSILSTCAERNLGGTRAPSDAKIYCRNCGNDCTEKISRIAIPYVFTYLCNELAAMNIRLTLDIGPS